MAQEPATACRRCGSPLAPGLHGNCASCLLGLAGDTEVVGRHDAERIPARIGGYELLAPIAAGGMGVVYRARQEGLARDIALKLISTGRLVRPEQVQRFYTEARAVARLAHPHIVPVHAAGEDDGRHYLAMPLMEGGTLAERLATLPPPGSVARLRSAATWIALVARAVHHAHRHGVLHRDLKPANILFDDAGQPHVADFGLARLLDEESGLTRSQVLLGTPDYLAPEVARGGAAEATVASDVFSLGAMLYEVLCGFPPFSGPTPLETLRRASEGPAPAPSRRRPGATGRIPALERRLDHVCLKALAPRPEARYGSAEGLAEDLERWLRGDALVARPESTPERLARLLRRNPALSSALAALVLAVAVGLGVAWRQGRSNSRNLYAADLHIASEAVAGGDIGLARELLGRHSGPAPDFAWRLLDRLAAGDERTALDLHPWIVNAVEVSPDGRSVLSGSVGSGTVGDAVHLAPMDPGSPPRGFGTNGARSFGWFPDGRRFLAAHVDGRIRRWDVASGRVEHELPGLALALSADGRRLVTCEGNPFPWGGSPAGPTWLRRGDDDGEAPIRLPDARVVAIRRDGSLIAVSDAVSTIQLLDGATGSHRRTLDSGGRLWSLEFSPDGQGLVATGWQPEVRLWRLTEPDEAPRRLVGHTLSTWKAAFSPDGRRIVSSASDQTLRWWDARDGSPLGLRRGHASEVWCVRFSPDGSRVVSGGKDRTVFRWSASTPEPEPVFPHRSPMQPVFSADGTVLVTLPGVGEDGESRVQPLDGSAPPGKGPHGTPLGIDSQGHWLVQERPGHLAWIPPGNPGSRRERELEAEPGARIDYQQGAVSQDLTRVAGISSDGTVWIWDTREGRLRSRRRIAGLVAVGAAFSPDNRWLAIAAEEQGAWLCPVDGGPCRQLDRHRDQVRSVAFTPDSRRLATASVDATVGLWQVPGLEPVAQLRGHRTSADAVDVSPDGRIVASLESGTGVRLWDLATLRELAVLPVPDAGNFLRFSPDGRHLAVRTGSGIRLFSAP